MKRVRFGWVEALGIALLGGAGAYATSRYMNRPLGEKMRVGDVAFVPIGDVHMTETVQQSAVDLSSLGPAGNVAIDVTSLDPARGVAGRTFGLRVPVVFDRAKVARLERGGVAVP